MIKNKKGFTITLVTLLVYYIKKNNANYNFANKKEGLHLLITYKTLNKNKTKRI